MDFIYAFPSPFWGNHSHSEFCTILNTYCIDLSFVVVDKWWYQCLMSDVDGTQASSWSRMWWLESKIPKAAPSFHILRIFLGTWHSLLSSGPASSWRLPFHIAADSAVFFRVLTACPNFWRPGSHQTICYTFLVSILLLPSFCSPSHLVPGVSRWWTHSPTWGGMEHSLFCFSFPFPVLAETKISHAMWLGRIQY